MLTSHDTHNFLYYRHHKYSKPIKKHIRKESHTPASSFLVTKIPEYHHNIRGFIKDYIYFLDFSLSLVGSKVTLSAFLG